MVAGFVSANPSDKAQTPLPLTWDDSVIDRTAPEPASYAPMLKDVLESVVTIEISSAPAEGTELPPSPKDAAEAPEDGAPKSPFFHGGSGIILTSDGFVMTNAHVVDSGVSCAVRVSGYRRSFEAEVVGRDEFWDVALLKITPTKPLKAVTLVNTEPEIGDVAFVVGNPYGVGKTVTKGIVSALDRRGDSRVANGPANFIQTDAPIHPGNSGGPLVDIKGRVLGINSQVDDHANAGAGLGYAIPVLSVVKSCQKIWLNTHKQEGMFGLNLTEISDERKAELKIPDGVEGVLVSGVVKDLPADKAGLKADDVIVAVDDTPVADEPSCHFKLVSIEPGNSVRLKVFRQGKYEDIHPVAIAKPEE